MGRKTNKQCIEERIKTFLTVGELIEKLQQYPTNTVIGRVGHFGEICSSGKQVVSLKKGYVTPDGYWRNPNQKEINIIEIECPDIGEEPN